MQHQRLLILFAAAAFLCLAFCGVSNAQVCSMVGNEGYGIGGCFAAPGHQRILTVNGTSGSYCSFDDFGNDCCVVTIGNPNGYCVTAAQVVGILPTTQYTCVSPQPTSVAACPRCGVVCTSSLACGGGTDSCNVCKLFSNPNGTGTFKCAAPSVLRQDDVCLSEQGLQISC